MAACRASLRAIIEREGNGNMIERYLVVAGRIRQEVEKMLEIEESAGYKRILKKGIGQGAGQLARVVLWREVDQ